MKKPKKADFKNCQDPEFGYYWALYTYMLWKQARNNPFLKELKK